ncbi:putative Glutamyl-tRNA reductase [Marvinbryantia formatexigens DSM 14469]|uniref:Glutamyl-tRNA reductase n=1 Tax=Marvinbryantia formatexigens DSM 14469 TaxID=478749 RepID=C6L9T9_9FIRM|nr:glutamyl-tRNA reductase [Marvinbryantia formatexigens]EET62346.1 putative Glutamyl-tRNA reductase [Marvinbryantia formatexigens DSM 14469]UWO25098.1 glutamyl-tRNA reductase [Marvinbryantia formatexigens DSM 14469]SDG95334.1 glutamyl-tRNA reductase [Marvinbryantia formatexigens]
MSIYMAGIDHTKAPLDVRSVFSFTKKNMAGAMERWKNIPGLQGCVMIVTCNRMELWASVQDDVKPDLFELLCQEKGVDARQYRQYAVFREGREAVSHLFEVSCGLQSRILGEDQIITQVKDALAFAREQYATDNVLEVLFRMAVTAGKKVKTEVLLSKKDSSVIHRAVEVLKEEGYTFEGKKCMVIGNGEMGRLSANVFRSEGADVTVTVRSYRSGVVDIPRGCRRINYAERMTLFPQCDYVISATASPNYTLRREEVEAALDGPVVMVDLAVPRDIEPSIGSLAGVTLYDIDYFDAGHISAQTQADIARAKEILQAQIAEFFDWYEGRDVIEKIQDVREALVEDFHLRTQKKTRELGTHLEPESSGMLQDYQEYIETAAAKTIGKMMFGLRRKVSDRTFRECMEALEDLYEKDNHNRQPGEQAGSYPV